MQAVVRWAGNMLAALKKPPPKLYFPSFVNLDGFLARFKEAQRKEGFGRAYNKTRMESTLRKGTLVGSDYNGNKYYEDRDAPYGRTRWVEYPTPPGVWAIEQKYDGSMVRTSNLFVLPNAYPLRAPRALPGGASLQAESGAAGADMHRYRCARGQRAGQVASRHSVSMCSALTSG